MDVTINDDSWEQSGEEIQEMKECQQSVIVNSSFLKTVHCMHHSDSVGF